MVASDYSKLLGVATSSKYSYKNPIPRYFTHIDIPSKIIPQCSLCLQVTTDKIWNQYLHIQRRSEPFPHSDQRCLFCTIGHVDQNCINFWFSEFAYIFSKYCFWNFFIHCLKIIFRKNVSKFGKPKINAILVNMADGAKKTPLIWVWKWLGSPLYMKVSAPNLVCGYL